MKKSVIRLAVAAGLLLVMACGGYALSAGDSLITLSYLRDVFLPQAVQQGEDAAQQALQDTYDEAEDTLNRLQKDYLAEITGEDGLYSSSFKARTWSEGDVVELPTGSGVLMLGGTAAVVHNGALVDVTEGIEVPSGSRLTAKHRYLAGENTLVQIKILSGAAQMGVQGAYDYTDGGVKATPFYDVCTDDWYHDAVNYVYENQLFSGMGEHEFAPSADMTRAMMMTVLYRLAGSPEREMAVADVTFDDVPETAWFAPFVKWGASQQVTAGTGDNRFSPDMKVTREQVVVMLYSFANRYMGLGTSGQGDLSAYPDVDQVSDWALEGMSWAVAKGIVGEATSADALLAPRRDASRAEVAAMLHAFSENIL